jgi:hypothetical protein
MSTVDELDPNAHPPGGVFIEGEPLNNPAEGPLFVWLFALAVVAAVDFSVVLPTQYDYIKKVGGDAWHSQRLVSGGWLVVWGYLSVVLLWTRVV